jgi:RecA/RadA recombinase
MVRSSNNEPSIGKLSSKPDEQFIQSGTKLDDLIGGGFARSRITELWAKKAAARPTWQLY